MLKKVKKSNIVPMDVPKKAEKEYLKNYSLITKNTDRLMLFAGDQKFEHLNDDFNGKTNEDFLIPEEDNDPEHLFRIASQGIIGAFAAQFGLISKYARYYPKINYIVKVNSKTNIVKTKQKDPLSLSLVDFESILDLKKRVNIVGIGYTIFLGSEYEAEMVGEAGRLVSLAHQHGLITILWIYPRGKAIKDEKDPHLIAGAAGVALCLGSDFVKVNYPNKDGFSSKDRAESFKEAIKAAGKTKVITAGGSSKDPKLFLQELYEQIHISGASGNATGRNIHQKTLKEAIRMCNAISSITYGNKSVDFAYDVYLGKKEFKL
ncbi:MAG: aldolase [Candidatus Woesearchaeota archaeon]